MQGCKKYLKGALLFCLLFCLVFAWAEQRVDTAEDGPLLRALLKGAQFLGQGSLRKARHEFTRAKRLDPNNPIATRGLAMILEKRVNVDSLFPNVREWEDGVRKRHLQDLVSEAKTALLRRQYDDVIRFADGALRVDVVGEHELRQQAEFLRDEAEELLEDLAPWQRYSQGP